jgi:hypothetical protein
MWLIDVGIFRLLLITLFFPVGCMSWNGLWLEDEIMISGMDWG